VAHLRACAVQVAARAGHQGELLAAIAG
jgi:hypothetical protein